MLQHDLCFWDRHRTTEVSALRFPAGLQYIVLCLPGKDLTRHIMVVAIDNQGDVPCLF